MKRIAHKALLIIILSPVMMLLENCTSSDDCGGGSGTPYFDIQGVELDAYRSDLIARKNYRLGSGARSPADQVYFKLNYSVNYISKRSFNLLNNHAYACSPIFSGDYGTKGVWLEKFDIITLNPIPGQYEANDTINDLLEIKYQGEKIGLDAYQFQTIKYIGVQYESHGIYFKTPPPKGLEMQFKIAIELSDGERYEAETGLFQTKK